MKIAIGIPHYDMFAWDFVQSLLFMVKKTKHAMHIIAEKSPYIHKSRNAAFREAQNVGADYLLMIDCDMSFPDDALQKLIDLDKDVASGMYYKRPWPHFPLAYEWTGKPDDVHRNISEIPAEPFKIDSTGAGLLLISKKVLDGYTDEVYREHGKPFSHKIFDDGKGGETIGEDTSFCMRMTDLGYEVWIDPTIELGHIGTQVVKQDHWEMGKQQLLNGTGWTTDKELKFLAEMAKTARSIVEIGCWKGQSTKVLLEASEGVIHAIDHFEGSKTDESFGFAKVQDVYSQFMDNVGHYPNLRVHKMGSEDAVSSFKDGELDLVWIDADHSHEGCSRDIDLWLPKVKKGGLICGHDYGVCSGVTTSVDNRFEDVGLIDSLWYKRVA
jgi:predicted O-methyltransferase YrrM